MQRFSAFLFGALLACAAGAQPPARDAGPPPDEQSDYAAPAQQDQADPPARVARLAYLNGSVSFTPAGENEWVQAQLNRPVVTGDKLWTADGAHAELQIGAATVELGDQSSFDFLNLDDQLAQMELTQGELNIDVRRLRGNESYEVDTPMIAFVANRVGDYRIEVDPQSGATIVTARRGSGDAVGEGGRRVTVEEGQSVRFNDSQLSDYQVNNIGAPDEFDHYVRMRGERYAQAQPRGYVSEDVTGYEDLDAYGAWDDSPEYGHVWYPSEVPEDWAPYHYGQWEWIDPWGWTWVDDAPWGFAPFHYGRWAYIDSRWGWVPGPIDVEPVYAPALVAFVGGGFGVDISIGGPIGWFALGPRDVYFPGYRCGHDYFTRVNVGNAYVSTTVINNYYGDWSRGRIDYSHIQFANRDAPRALMAVNRAAFVAGRPVASARVAVNRTTLANARIMARPSVLPTRQSLFAGRARAAAPPARAANRAVVAAHQPPPARPSFAQRQPLLQRSGGQPLSTTQLRSLSASRAPTRGRAAVAQNVRVVGNGRAMTERGVARATAAPATAARAAAARGTVSANGRRNETGSPSRAPEMNRSPARANAQYLRSAGYAHQGVVPGSERATPANGRGPRNARGPQNARRPVYAGAPGNEVRRGPGGATTAAQSRVRSSEFVRESARGNAGERGVNRPEAVTQRGRANERATITQRERYGAARRSAQTHTTVPAPSPSTRGIARRAETATAHVPSDRYASPSSRAISARERTRSPQFATPSPNRPAAQQRVRPYQPSTPNYRASERASAQHYRAPPRQSAPVTRPSYAEQPRRQAAPYREPPHMQAPSRPAYAQQPQRQAPQYREPPHAQAPVQRSAPQRTASAKQSAPRERRNAKDKDNNHGG